LFVFDEPGKLLRGRLSDCFMGKDGKFLNSLRALEMTMYIGHCTPEWTLSLGHENHITKSSCWYRKIVNKLIRICWRIDLCCA